MNRAAFVLTLLLLPVAAFARSFDASHLPYPDVPSDDIESIAISVLTQAKVVQGNPDGTFGPNAALNRAEFLKIAMGLLPEQDVEFALDCFPDVAEDIWYAESACKAKALGIVQGNADPDLPKEEWPFAPERPVQYEEAVKILAGIYGYTIEEEQEGEQWYERFMRSAEKRNTQLAELRAGQKLTRGQMARLAVRFLAESEGELNALFSAEEEKNRTCC